MALQFARVMLDAAPLGADIDEAKFATAREAGAQHVYNSQDPASLKQLHSDTNGGVLAAIDFVGSESSLAFASGAVRKGGRVLVVGLMGGTLEMPIAMFPLRSIGIDGSFVGSLAETHEMMQLVRTGKIAPIPIEERPLEAASRSLEDLRAGRVIGRLVLNIVDQ
jgi:D-arabinose 1-dehydrogenase-like Zn-dependent alcohol dehydrogenase